MNAKLIDGKYTAKQGRDVLLSLIGFKLKFHELEVCQNIESGIFDNEEHFKRIEELQQLREHVLVNHGIASAADMMLRITCKLDIELLFPSPSNNDQMHRKN
jgi:hypothetical protein